MKSKNQPYWAGGGVRFQLHFFFPPFSEYFHGVLKNIQAQPELGSMLVEFLDSKAEDLKENAGARYWGEGDSHMLQRGRWGRWLTRWKILE